MWWVLLHVGRCEVQFLESLYDNIVCGMIIINIMWVADRPVVIVAMRNRIKREVMVITRNKDHLLSELLLE